MTEPTHDCPGCGTQVPRHLLACKPDWRRLPQVLRNRVYATASRRAAQPDRHRRAVADALGWYRDNPAMPHTTGAAS